MTKQETLEKLAAMSKADATTDGLYHTFYIKKQGDGYIQVYSKEEADNVFAGAWCHNKEADKIMDSMKEIEGGSLLDAGCCDGYFGFMFEELGAKVSFLDFSARKPRGMVASVLGREHDFTCQNIYQLDKLGKKHDYIWCQDVLCHLLHPMLAIMNFRRSCNKKIFIGMDRLRTSGLEIDYLYQSNEDLWTKVAIERMAKSVQLYGSIGYPFTVSPTAFKRQLCDLGFKDVHIKFSYTAQGNERDGRPRCQRIIDVYEGTVNHDFDINSGWFAGHDPNYLHILNHNSQP